MLNHKITLIGNIVSTEVLLELVEQVRGNTEAETVESVLAMIASGNPVSIEEASPEVSAFKELKSTCLFGDIGWKEVVYEDDASEPLFMRTWMPGFEHEAYVPLTFGKAAVSISVLDTALEKGTDAARLLLADLRKHSLEGVEQKLTVHPDVVDAYRAGRETVVWSASTPRM